jgi:hypothetical protein
MLAAVISGAANGAITGFAAIGIDPTHFNLAAGFVHTLSLAGVSAVMSGIIGVAAYLKQSPLPGNGLAPETRDDRRDPRLPERTENLQDEYSGARSAGGSFENSAARQDERQQQGRE